MMGRCLHLPVNVDDLALKFEQIWQELPHETIRDLYQSIPLCVAACIHARGMSNERSLFLHPFVLWSFLEEFKIAQLQMALSSLERPTNAFSFLSARYGKIPQVTKELNVAGSKEGGTDLL
ncbi:hypothetical protein TNCV_699271 [Trichonephila clavipes]|nr:hypothetical protein TNCV_699271 [Trichonephila clavipes]